MVSLEPVEAQPRRVRDASRQIGRGRTRRDPAPPHADLDLDETAELHAGPSRGARRRIHLPGIVEAERDPGRPGEGGQPVDLRLAHHLVRDQHVRDAASHQSFRLADLLHALPDGAGRDLPLRDGDASVGLRVRPQCDAGRRHIGRHAGDVAVEGVEIDHEGRRVDLVERGPDLGGRVLHDRQSIWSVATIGEAGAGRDLPRPRSGATRVEEMVGRDA